jgi:hypothetical protein
MLVGLRQEELEVREWHDGIYPRTNFARTFRDDQGRRYRWYGTNPSPVNLRGYRYPGRYRVLPEVSLTFSATVREIWPDGTVSISRPYIRLDRQPEATRRAYAGEYGISLYELGLEPEPDADVVAIETDRAESSGEIASGNGSRVESNEAWHGLD